jgi:hypothetical protein
MDVVNSDRGLEYIHFENRPHSTQKSRLVSQSSAVGDYTDSASRPGSSNLWVGAHHHLSREQVRELVQHLNNWLETGSLRNKA